MDIAGKTKLELGDYDFLVVLGVQTWGSQMSSHLEIMYKT